MRVAGHLRREGVDSLYYLILFIVSVIAGVVVHIISKWLDGD